MTRTAVTAMAYLFAMVDLFVLLAVLALGDHWIMAVAAVVLLCLALAVAVAPDGAAARDLEGLRRRRGV